ncbi:MAG: hypothetical protein RSG50_09660 [Clostridia bacterium]
MKFMVRTGLVVVLVLALCLPTGLASPGLRQRTATISMQMDAHLALSDPFARWLEEICALSGVVFTYAKWDGGESLSASLDMGVKRAFDLRLSREGSVATLTSSLLALPVRLPVLSPWADDLLEGARAALDMPSAGRVIAYSGPDLAEAMAAVSVALRAGAATARGQITQDCAGCGSCENCLICESAQALAMLLETFADCFLAVEGANVLVVRIQSAAAEPLAILPEDAELSDAALVKLTDRALRAVCTAIAGNPSGVEPPAF